MIRLGPEGSFKVLHKLEEHKLKVASASLFPLPLSFLGFHEMLTKETTFSMLNMAPGSLHQTP